MKKLNLKLITLITSIILLAGCNPAPAHIHTFSSEWSKDETNHWHAATCGHDVKSGEAAHSFGEWTIDREATEERAGEKHRTCSICEYVQVEEIPYTPVHTHTFESTWTSDSTHHWHAATCGHDVKDSYEIHNYGEWVIDKEATPTEDGHKHRTCEVCEYVEEKDIKYTVQVDASRIYLDKADISVFTNYDYQLNPVVIPENATKNVKYVIDDPAIVRMTDNKALALKAGHSIVTAYNDNNDNGQLDSDEPTSVVCFTVSDPEAGTYFNVKTPTINIMVGDEGSLEFEFVSDTYHPFGFDYGYYSSNEEICTIASKGNNKTGGRIVAHKPGTTQVSVSYKGYRGLATVNVTDKTDSSGLRCSSIDVLDKVVTAEKGSAAKINFSLLPSGNVDTVTSITSNNTKVATSDNQGNLTLKEKGSALFTIATSNGVKERVKVVVTDSTINDTVSYCNNYYGDLTWEDGEDLKAKLHNIISKNVTALKYDAPNWESNQYADEYFYDPNYVEVVYATDPMGKDAHGSSGSVWQREHAFAASLMTGFTTGAAVTSLGRATDFHNLLAANGGGNTSRGNKNFGYANPLSADYGTKDGADIGYVRKAFEPNDIDKGRLARAIFYMGVMYNTVENATVKETWTYSGPDTESHSGKTKTVTINSKEQPVEIVESTVEYNKISLNNFMYTEDVAIQNLVKYYRDLALEKNPSLVEGSDEHRQVAYALYNDAYNAYAIGNLSSLLEWNTFSVDLYEMQHNESVYSHNSTQGKGTQGNRNPFVDYPELVDYVYGPLQDQPGSLKNLIPSYKALEMDKDEIHHYSVDSSKNPTFEVGDSFDLASVNNIKAIKNDLSEGALDKSKLSYSEYTFVDADVNNGKDITITSDKNNFVIHCIVKGSGGGGGEGASSISECTYNYLASTGNKSDYSGSGTTYVATFGTQRFDVTFGAEVDTFKNKNTDPAGVTIGKADIPVGSLTFVSKNSFNLVDSVYFKGSGAANTEYNWTIKVNGSTVLSGKTTGSTAGEFGGILSTPVSGVVTIEITNITKAINFCGLGINYAA